MQGDSEAFGNEEIAFGVAHHLAHIDRGRFPAQAQAAITAPDGLHQTQHAKVVDYLGQMVLWNAEAFGHFFNGNQPFWVNGKGHQDAQGVVGLQVQFHGFSSTLRFTLAFIKQSFYNRHMKYQLLVNMDESHATLWHHNVLSGGARDR